ncbi:MAG: integrase core domain-containing protein [Pseudomonadota bacterium]
MNRSFQWIGRRSNGYDERSIGTLHHELLDAEWFATLRQAQTVIKT